MGISLHLIQKKLFCQICIPTWEINTIHVQIRCMCQCHPCSKTQYCFIFRSGSGIVWKCRATGQPFSLPFFLHRVKRRWWEGKMLELTIWLRRKRSGCWIDGHFCGMLGYADDIMLISPTVDGLQEMIDTSSNFMKSHNLSFSTNPNPRKCKTKCMAFLKKDRDITPLQMNGDDLPWVTSAKHLGTKVENKGLQKI